VTTLEKSHDSILATADVSVVANVPSALASSRRLIRSRGFRRLPQSLLSTPTAAVPEKTQAPIRVSSDASPSLVSTDIVTSRPESTQASEGPDAYDWNIALASRILLVLYIVPSELQLWWNHLDGIYSVNTTGQIIPLSLGSLSLFRALYLLKEANWSKLWRDPKKVLEQVKELKKKLNDREEWKVSE
jgi:hypothetical protein